MQGVAEGAAANGGNGRGLVALEAWFGAELEADGRVVAGLADGAPEREEFGGGDVDLFLLEEARRETCSAKHGRNRNAVFGQPGGPDAGDLESVGGDFVRSHGFKIALIGNRSLAECAKILADRAHVVCYLIPPHHSLQTDYLSRIAGRPAADFRSRGFQQKGPSKPRDELWRMWKRGEGPFLDVGSTA